MRLIDLEDLISFKINKSWENSSERPKPEFSAETGTRTEIIPVR